MKSSESKNIVWDALKKYAGGTLKKNLIKMAVKQTTEFLFKKLAFLAWGPLGGIVTFFVTKGVVLLMDKTIIGAHILFIYGDVTIDKKAMRKVIIKFKQLEREGMSDEERKKLDEELAQAGRDLIRFGTL